MIGSQTREFSRAMLPHHVLALAATIALSIFLAYDRREPLLFEHGEIVPEHAMPGERVIVRWTTDWRRQCEGVVSRDLVGSDNVIKIYRSRPLRVPAQLGRQTADTPFHLPETMPLGHAEYRAIVRFESCGITSRIWPLQLNVPALSFDVIGRAK